MRNAFPAGGLTALLVLVATFSAAEAAGDGLALHRALYDFKLISAEPGMGINGVRGKMYFEQDATCDAWTAEHRFTMEYGYAERAPSVDASHYVSFESRDGQTFGFNSERQENDETTEQLRGSVRHEAGGKARAVYSRPDGLSYALPEGYLLPTAHTLEMIRHARAGDRIFNAVLFDGTDAQGPAEVNVFFGKKASPEELAKISKTSKNIDVSLLTAEAWHVRMAVFPLSAVEESEPSYEMDMLLHDNGVISHAVVDYKSFVVEQNLAALEKIQPPKCP